MKSRYKGLLNTTENTSLKVNVNKYIFFIVLEQIDNAFIKIHSVFVIYLSSIMQHLFFHSYTTVYNKLRIYKFSTLCCFCHFSFLKLYHYHTLFIYEATHLLIEIDLEVKIWMARQKRSNQYYQHPHYQI